MGPHQQIETRCINSIDTQIFQYFKAKVTIPVLFLSQKLWRRPICRAVDVVRRNFAIVHLAIQKISIGTQASPSSSINGLQKGHDTEPPRLQVFSLKKHGFWPWIVPSTISGKVRDRTSKLAGWKIPELNGSYSRKKYQTKWDSFSITMFHYQRVYERNPPIDPVT